MPTIVTSTTHLIAALPPAPSTTDVGDAVAARLTALTDNVLPTLRATRDFLTSFWHSEAPDAHVLYADSGQAARAIVCDPVGADRLATVLATEGALVREQAALRDLREALMDYELGGRQIRVLLDAEAEPTPAFTATSDQTPRGPSAATRRTHTLRLRAYLALIDRDLASAAAAGDAAGISAYTLERDTVRERLAQQLGHTPSEPLDHATRRALRVKLRRSTGGAPLAKSA